MKERKIKYLEVLPIIVLSILVYKLFNSYELVFDILGQGMTILIPFFWAFAFAYLINPLMKKISERFNLGRGLSILISYIIVIGALSLIVTFVAPGLSASISDIINQIPTYAETITEFVEEMSEKYQIFEILQLSDSLIEAEKRGIIVKGIYFGYNNKLKNVLTHRRLKTYLSEKEERNIVVIIDRKEAITGIVSRGEASQVSWTNDPGIIDITSDYIVHDLMVNSYSNSLSEKQRKEYEDAMDEVRKEYFK